MSPAYCVVMALFVGPGIDRSSVAEPPAGKSVAQSTADLPFDTPRAAREAVARALRESNRASGRDPVTTVPSVVAAYRQLAASTKLAPVERRRLEGQLRTRLSEQYDVLHRRALRDATGSGGVSVQAQELMDLIQTTIAPKSWAASGGRGTMAFYAPLNVLVVRQTAEAHESIGSTLGQLRR